MNRAPLHIAAALVAAVLPATPAGAVTLTPVGRFDSPVYVTAPPGDTERVFVVERRGSIRLIERGRLLRRPFLDLTASVTVTRDPDDERGLLSMAFAPDYAATGRFYVYRVAARGSRAALGGKIMIEEFQNRGTAARRTDPATRRLVLAIPAGKNHFGGQLAFGPDGYLWLGPGDGFRNGDPQRNAQDRRTLLGKLLRIDPRPGARLPAPGNPFRGRTGHPLVWAFGLRNPFRFSFDRLTGDLAIGDVGQNFAEEVDFAPRAAGLGRGANYGWSVLEGTFRYRRAAPQRLRPARRREIPRGAVAPALQQLHRRGGWCSIIGGYVVRDPALPELAGRYVYGDLCRPMINSTALTATGARDVRPTGLRVRGLVSFGEDGCGRVYAVSILGPVHRLSRSGRCAGPAPTPFAIPQAMPGDDLVRPVVTATARPHQRGGAARAVRLEAGCDERCTIRVTGRLVVRRGSRPVASTLAPASTGPLEPGATAGVALGIPGAARRDLRATGRGRVWLAVVATDLAGNRRARHLRVTLLR